MNMIPIPVSSTSALIVAAGSRGIQTRTQRAEVHETGEGDGQEVLGVDNIVTIELGEIVLDILVRECGINGEQTKKPSANQLLKRNKALGTTLIASA